jgi:hypothetical protein
MAMINSLHNALKKRYYEDEFFPIWRSTYLSPVAVSVKENYDFAPGQVANKILFRLLPNTVSTEQDVK